MAGSWDTPLAVNIDATYADTGSSDVKLHQQYHDTLHGFYNAGQVLVRWSGTAWESRPTGAAFGVLFLSSNDAAAPNPPTTGLRAGDRWKRHPSAS